MVATIFQAQGQLEFDRNRRSGKDLITVLGGRGKTIVLHIANTNLCKRIVKNTGVKKWPKGSSIISNMCSYPYTYQALLRELKSVCDIKESIVS